MDTEISLCAFYSLANFFPHEMMKSSSLCGIVFNIDVFKRKKLYEFNHWLWSSDFFCFICFQGNEGRLYEFIVRHFLACVSQDALGQETVVDIDIALEKFSTSGLMIIARNYLDVYPYDRWTTKVVCVSKLHYRCFALINHVVERFRWIPVFPLVCKCILTHPLYLS